MIAWNPRAKFSRPPPCCPCGQLPLRAGAVAPALGFLPAAPALDWAGLLSDWKTWAILAAAAAALWYLTRETKAARRRRKAAYLKKASAQYEQERARIQERFK